MLTASSSGGIAACGGCSSKAVTVASLQLPETRGVEPRQEGGGDLLHLVGGLAQRVEPGDRSARLCAQMPRRIPMRGNEQTDRHGGNSVAVSDRVRFHPMATKDTVSRIMANLRELHPDLPERARVNLELDLRLMESATTNVKEKRTRPRSATCRASTSQPDRSPRGEREASQKSESWPFHSNAAPSVGDLIEAPREPKPATRVPSSRLVDLSERADDLQSLWRAPPVGDSALRSVPRHGSCPPKRTR